ncbi:AMP-dependent synthetase/ligase [Metarhizium rileyi]|uniref:AMP-dependent synthetase/ligase n=1 Tax=Metarhizium rileyi (strain RCEF 4871) TaxID=1649241 RepID=A0A167ERZ8_METRR|nr:AMP-dependent synthetase/ligase [Metarhizium rileyi RCEF 4871]
MSTRPDMTELQSQNQPASQKLSVLHGPVDPPLVDLTLGELLQLQTYQHGTQECIVIPWTGARWTYNELNQQSSSLAEALLDMGVGVGDRVGIMAGNCEQYAAVFFAVAKIGAILVILNNTYTPTEAMYGLKFSDCKLFFTTQTIGRLDNRKLLAALDGETDGPEIVILRGEAGKYQTYDSLTRWSSRKNHDQLYRAMQRVLPHQVVNLQFTSGTTGLPKAAMLTHHNLVNNSRFIGDRMRLTTEDILCCPPPMFHCFGLVLGLLATVTHGGKIVYPAEVFEIPSTLQSISDEGCTAVHGVPAMFDSLFQADLPPGFRCDKLRTGIIAGAPVPRYLMELLVNKFGMTEFTSSYGLTEASPTCFNAFTDDALSTRLTTVGTLMPHAQAKIVDRDGNIVPVGTRGELCMAGYQLQAGYWNNSEKTNEAMVRDAAGLLWLHTGDEAVFDENGYCTITGRFKDIIIRGGENIYPLEIEERLMAHPSVSRAIVVGLKDKHYGEVVGTFVEKLDNSRRPTDAELRDWVRKTLGKHKSPAHIFWLGRDGVPLNVPLTGSGKVRKFEMAKTGDEILSRRSQTSKL